MLRKVMHYLEELFSTYKITPSVVDKLNTLLREVTKNQNARIEIRASGDHLFDIDIYPGIPGPTHKKLIKDEYLRILLHGIIKLEVVESIETNGYKLKTGVAKDTQNQNFYIQIRSIPEKYINSWHENSLYNCLIRYQQYFKNKNLDFIFTYDDDSPDNESCVKDLTSVQIINNLTKWEPKKVGYMPGLILKEANGNKTFVKQFVGEESLDFAVLKIAKSCGVTAPKVKVVATKEHCYQFSDGLANSSDKKTYQYNDLADHIGDKNIFFDKKNLILYKNRNPDGTFQEYFNVDKTSVARLILITAIFALGDLRTCNIGFRISQQGLNKKVKLALIDFQIYGKIMHHYGIRLVNPMEVDTQKNLIEFLLDQVVLKNNKLLTAMNNKLTMHDYINAFEKIEKNFETAYAEVKKPIELVVQLLKSQMTAEQYEDLINVSNKIWLSNYTIVRDKVAEEKVKLKSDFSPTNSLKSC